jgi:hypothetical protein
MPALLRYRKIHLWGAYKKTRAAMNDFHAPIQPNFPRSANKKIRQHAFHRFPLVAQHKNA